LAFLARLVHRTTAGQRRHVGLRGGAPGVFGGGGLGGDRLRTAGALPADRALLVAALGRRRLRVVGDAVGILPLVDLAAVHGGCNQQAGGGDDQDRKAGHRQAPAGDVGFLGDSSTARPLAQAGRDGNVNRARSVAANAGSSRPGRWRAGPRYTARMEHPTPAPPRGRGIYLLPNLFTTGGLFAGFFAIIAASQGRYGAACIAIFVAAILDGIDGRVARLTNTQSEFGVQYDSLADLISFGMAPALVMYHWALVSM